MRIVIAIFFFLGALAFLVLPWRSENGVLIKWPTRIVLAVVCTLAGLGALFVPYSD
jgi:hypothetical protein